MDSGTSREKARASGDPRLERIMDDLQYGAKLRAGVTRGGPPVARALDLAVRYGPPWLPIVLAIAFAGAAPGAARAAASLALHRRSRPTMPLGTS